MKIFLLILLIGGSRGFDLFLDATVHSLLDHFEKVLNETEPSQCTDDLKLLTRDAKLKKAWALKMFDAAGKPTSGSMLGNIRQPGSYDECIETVGVANIRGKHCLAAVTPAQKYIDEVGFMRNSEILKTYGINFTRKNLMADVIDKTLITWGICVPRSCYESELNLVSNNSEVYFDMKTHLEFKDFRCSTGEKKPLTAAGYFAIFFFVTIAAVLTASTYYDVKVKNKGIHADLYSSFSVYTNSKKLFSTRMSQENLGAINGLRFLSIMWVILGHTYMSKVLFPASTNPKYAFAWTRNLKNVFVIASPLSVDTFLTISGFLVVYVYLTLKVNKGLEVHWGKFYLHRFLRLTPALLAIVIFYTGLLPHLGNGPFWFQLEIMQYKDCVDNWWSTLLYIQNYQNSLNECINQSWYLAVDTQLYILSPIILIPLTRKPKLGLMFIGLLLGVSSGVAYWVTIYYQIGAITMDAGTDFFKYLYHPTHTRLMPWLVGAAWGYIMQKTKNKKVKLHTATVIFLWLLHASIMLAIMCLHIILAWYEYNPTIAALFNAFARPLWSMGICWVIFACCNGYGGFIDVCLNNKVFTILCRFTYSLFLLHMSVILVIALQRRDPEYISNQSACVIFWAYFSISLLLSLIWVLAFESPVLNLEKIIFGSKSPNSTTPPDVRVNPNIKESVA